MLPYILFAFIVVLLLIVIGLIARMNKSETDTLLHQKIDSLKDEFTKNILQAQSNSLQASRDLLAQLAQLYERIGSLDRDSSEILGLTKSFHDILKPTKARGLVGESILEMLLLDALPHDVILTQHTFKNGKKVDFGIRLPHGVVPIDAKFSLEAFKNYIDAPEADRERLKKVFTDSVKKRIDETAAYIFPDEGTTDFSLMYVPSEGVYYNIIVETTLLEYAQGKRVFIVGPHTLYVYLRTILIGFHALSIEKQAKEIYVNLRRLDEDIKGIMEEHAVLGTHLRNANLKYDDVRKKIEAVSGKLTGMGKDPA